MEESGVYIRMMGSFAITVNGVTTSRMMVDSPKGLSLLELLYLADGDLVPVPLLCKQLWADVTLKPGFEEDDVQQSRIKSRLKTLICRTRQYLNQLSPGLGACIASLYGAYAWQPLPNVTVDVAEVERLCSVITEASPLPEEQWPLADQLIGIYRNGLYLTGDWPDGEREAFRLHQEYRQAIFCYLQSLERKGEFQRLFRVCRRELKTDPDNRDLRAMQTVAWARLKEKNIIIPEDSPEYRDEEARTQKRVLEPIPEEMANVLRTLPIVEKVTEKRIRFTKEFKEHFIREYAKGRPAWEIFRGEGVLPEVIGWGRIAGLCITARKEIQHRQAQPDDTERLSQVNDSARLRRKIYELESELSYLNKRVQALEK